MTLRDSIRRWWPGLAALAGLAVLLASALAAGRHVGPLEEELFRTVNRLPGALYLPLWTVMQAGSLAGVVLAVAGPLLSRRWGLSARLTVAGALAYLLPKVGKALVARGRPPALLDAVVLRDHVAGLGFPSGHTAVAVALALTALPFLGRRGRIAVLSGAALVALGRVYVGAHLPLDLLGGAALGLSLASLVTLAARAIEPWCRPRPGEAG